MKVDVSGNRAAKKYPARILFARCLWAAGSVLFRCIPRPFHGVRCAILRLFGATVGRRVEIYPTAVVFFPWNLRVGDDAAIGHQVLVYNLESVQIGNRATVSQRAHLCCGSHDITDPKMGLLKSPISIGDDAWVCADAFVGSGITIGQGAVVGARAVVTKDVAGWAIVAGNPAKEIGKRDLASASDSVGAN